MEKEFDTQGMHIIIDCYGTNSEVLDNLSYLKMLLTTSVELTGAKIIDEVEYKFEPNGVTLLHLLSESHASIHTYPENGYFGADIYTCGNHVDTKKGVDYLLSVLRPEQVNGVMIQRGNINGLFASPYEYQKGE